MERLTDPAPWRSSLSTLSSSAQAAGSVSDAATTVERPASSRLLSALMGDDGDSFERTLKLATFRVGKVLARPGEVMRAVYFPVSLVASVVKRMSDGSTVEVGTIGNEGMVGLAVFLESEVSDGETFVQIPGEAYCMPAAAFREAVHASAGARRLLNRYTQAYVAQVAQGVACNALHTIGRRCARWLLMTHDRMGGTQAVIPLKQEFLAMMLGVRRAGVSVAAGALQDAGLIRYRRGGIEILDHAGLERAACECYRVVRDDYDRLLPPRGILRAGRAR